MIGDFAGSKAIRAVAGYLKENDYRVSAFYTSNVEEYLYENQGFAPFAENVRQLPISDKSVFIRAVRAEWTPHSHWSPRDRITPFLQKIAVFLHDYSEGRISTYGKLVTSDFIGGTEPNLEDLLPGVQ